MSGTAKDSAKTPEDRLVRKAETLLKAPDLLARADDLIERLGLVGEEINRRLVFLAGVGGHLGEPLHLVVKGESSGGKNTLVKTPLKLLPAERVTFTAGLSEQALPYHEGPVEGVLVIEEADGQKHAMYTLRVAMSEGRVGRMTVNKGKKGRLQGETREVEVSASIITTTTSAALHAENQTRVFDLWVDDGEEQTRRVLTAKARRAAGTADPATSEELELWGLALGMLEGREVVIPFAEFLCKRFPTAAVRSRRDFDRVLTLLRISTLLHQRRREQDEQERLVADLEDYRLVYPLIQAVLGPSMSGITDKALRLFELHEELAADDAEGWVYRPDLEREALGRGVVGSKNTVHGWCRQFSNLLVWEGVMDRGRWKHRTLRDPREEPLTLPSAEELAAALGIPVASQSAGGRHKTSQQAQLQKSPSQGDGDHGNGRLKGASCNPALSTHNWESAVIPSHDYDNGSQSASWAALGDRSCLWCGEPKTSCGFCVGAREEVRHA